MTIEDIHKDCSDKFSNKEIIDKMVTLEDLLIKYNINEKPLTPEQQEKTNMLQKKSKYNLM